MQGIRRGGRCFPSVELVGTKDGILLADLLPLNGFSASRRLNRFKVM
jgi:hypothetical protein